MHTVNFNCCAFVKSDIKGIYNKENQEHNFPFDFLKFERAKSDYLTQRGAQLVVQSWTGKGSKKILMSGLLTVPHCKDAFYGNRLNDNGKKDFFIIYMVAPKRIVMFFFKNKNPRNKSKFFTEFYIKIRKGYIPLP